MKRENTKTPSERRSDHPKDSETFPTENPEEIEKRRRKLEKEVDEGLEQTFPASDPPAHSKPSERTKK